MVRRRIDEHQQRSGRQHAGHTAVPGPAVVHQEPDAGLHERRSRPDGNQRPVLQLHMHDRQRGRAEHRGRRQRVQDVQNVRRHMPDRSRGHHSDIHRQRSEREECGSRPVLACQPTGCGGSCTERTVDCKTKKKKKTISYYQHLRRVHRLYTYSLVSFFPTSKRRTYAYII